jgi:hypothetical protein
MTRKIGRLDFFEGGVQVVVLKTSQKSTTKDSFYQFYRNSQNLLLTPSLVPPHQQVLGDPGEEGEAGTRVSLETEGREGGFGGGDLEGRNGQLNHKVIG